MFKSVKSKFFALVIAVILIMGLGYMIITYDYSVKINLKETKRHQKAFLNVAVSFLDSLDDEKNKFRKDAKKAYEDQIISVMDVAFAFLDTLYALGAKDQAIESLYKLRYGKNGYFYVLDQNLEVVEHPYLITGQKDFKQLRDALGASIGEKIEQAAKNGGNFFEYMWPIPGQTNPVGKLAYAKEFSPWGWYICTGIFLDAVEKEAEGRVLKAEELFGISFSKVPLLGDAHMLLFNGKKQILFQDPALVTITEQQDQITGKSILELLIEASNDKSEFIRYLIEVDGANVWYESYAHYFPPLDSYVATLGPVTSFTLVSRELLWRQMVFLTCGTLLFLLIALVVVRKVTRPLQSLTKKVESFSLHGEKNKKKLVKKSSDEILELSLKFDEMKHRIEEDLKKLIDLTRVQSELIVARETQQKMLPTNLELKKAAYAVEISGVLLPFVEVAGDFYDYFIEDGRWLYIAIGDVSDKGMSSAWTMTMVMTMLRIFSKKTAATPQEILTRINQEYVQRSCSFDFITMWLGQIDLRTGRLVYCQAGHPPALCQRKNHGVQYLESKPARPLGISADTLYANESFFLEKGDVILLYTDGVTDAINPEAQFFTATRLKKTLENTIYLDAEEINQTILKEIKEFAKGQNYPDDITLLAMKYQGINYPIISKMELSKNSQEIAKAHSEIKNLIPPLDHSQIMEVELAIEEILQNIIDYSDAKEEKVQVQIELNQDSLKIIFVYKGIPFDPRKYLQEPCQKPHELGGKGLIIVSKLFEIADYTFTDDKNCLTLLKRKSHGDC